MIFKAKIKLPHQFCFKSAVAKGYFHLMIGIFKLKSDKDYQFLRSMTFKHGRLGAGCVGARTLGAWTFTCGGLAPEIKFFFKKLFCFK